MKQQVYKRKNLAGHRTNPLSQSQRIPDLTLKHQKKTTRPETALMGCWLRPTLDQLSQPIPPQSTIGTRRDMPRTHSSGATLPQRERKRKHHSSGEKVQKMQLRIFRKLREIQKQPKQTVKHGREITGAAHTRGPLPTSLPPIYHEGRKHLVKCTGDLREGESFVVQDVVGDGRGWVRSRSFTSGCPRSACDQLISL